MKTFIFEADYEHLQKAAELLKSGEVVAVPTETVYGLAANGLDEAAVAKIFAAKGRPQDNPLILHISDLAMLADIAEEIPELAKKLAAEFWPGPLTMIFPRKSVVPASTCGGLDTVAVRMPRQDFTRELIRRCGFPLAAPSANTSGLPSPTSAVHVFEDMNGKIPLIMDGGDCACGVESTVICFEENGVRILRPGAVTPEMLREYAKVTVDSGVLEKLEPNARVLSPGMKYKHYSPKAEVYIVEGTPDELYDFLCTRSAAKTAVLCGDDDKIPDFCIRLPYGTTPEQQAEHLFASLREADSLDCAEVYVVSPERGGMGLAVYNRLLRAAAFRVIRLCEQKEQL